MGCRSLARPMPIENIESDQLDEGNPGWTLRLDITKLVHIDTALHHYWISGGRYRRSH
jgi:hypothetical protein